MRPHKCKAASLAVLLALGAFPAFSPASAADPVLPPLLELPPWAEGFFWTYHYEGSDGQSFAGFTATSLNDTYTSSIVGEASTPRGDAWVLRNTHAGTMTGYGPGGLAGTATFTSLTYANIRKSDLATLNFTQDLDITANIQLIGNIHALAHNETYADPPLQDIPIGAPTDGTPFHVYSNLSSQGWFQIEPAPPQNVSSYAVFDYNLSVRGTENITVPAGTFAAYNYSAFGTLDFNGTVYPYSADYLWSPLAQSRVRDEAGFLLISHFVNRAPRWVAGEPYVRLDAGGYNDSLNLSTLLEDPEGEALVFGACVPDAPLGCTASAGGQLNVSSPPGVNATLNVTVAVSDGLPGGDFSARVRVLVRGPGNPNLAPTYIGPALVAIDEDTDFFGNVSALFEDPEGDPLTIAVHAGPPLFLVSVNDTAFHIRPPPNYHGTTSWSADAYDTAGNFVTGTSVVQVVSVNDLPSLFPVSPTLLDVHASASLNITADFTDPDTDPATHTMAWTVDGVEAFNSTSVWTFEYLPTNADAGNHTVSVTVSDGSDTGGPLNFSVLVWGGPTILGTDPPAAAFSIGNGSSVLFAVNATDPDTPSLTYEWWVDGRATGGASDSLVTFRTPGPHIVEVRASDNGSSDSFRWDVTVEQLPPRVAGMESPTDGLEVDANDTVPLRAFAHPGLENATFAWSINGVLFDTANETETEPLAAGVYNITLQVAGTYHGTIAYNATFAARVTAIAPDPILDPGNGNNNTTRPPPPPGGFDPLLLLLVLAAVAAVAAALMWRRRRRPEEGAPPIEAP